MKPQIAFVSRYDDTKEAEWIHALNAAMIKAGMTDETVISFRAMRQEARQRAEIAIVANPDPADLARLPAIKWIHGVWAGVERMVSELGEKVPPIVRLVDPELARIMAEAVLAWSYYIQRDMPAYKHQQEKKIWKALDYRAPSSMTVGLIGLGALGQAAAKRLHDAGFNVTGWARSTKNIPHVESYTGEDGLLTVLGKSDIIVLLVPLTDETRSLMNDVRFRAMKKGAALINFARGPVVEAEPMLAAIERGDLAHAVLDVFNTEPLPERCPYWLNPAITILPHISAPTSSVSASKIVAANIANWRKTGVLPTTVDMKRGY